MSILVWVWLLIVTGLALLSKREWLRKVVLGLWSCAAIFVVYIVVQSFGKVSLLAVLVPIVLIAGPLYFLIRPSTREKFHVPADITKPPDQDFSLGVVASVLLVIALTWLMPFIGVVIKQWRHITTLDIVAWLSWAGVLLASLVTKRGRLTRGLIIGLASCIAIGLLGIGVVLLAFGGGL